MGCTSKLYVGSDYYCLKCHVTQVELAGTSSSAVGLAFYLHLDENQEVAFMLLFSVTLNIDISSPLRCPTT